ncbi:HCP-like protein [Gigaspora rosea]|uniref:HCP-like protein n=1 Tax=Gigaspora rosea TaxID=44941 RepID=A0A397TWZ4_9GLOM|nr:HCP-like protein [Gigaspora rosea]
MNPHQYYQDPYYQDQYYGPPDEYGSRYGQPPRPYAENTNRYSGQRNSGPSNNVEDKTLYTPEAIEQYRQKIKSTTDLDALFAYARYIISASVHISRDEPDPKNAKKKKDALLQEAIKILKRLATQSMGRPSHPDAQFYLADCYGSGSLGLQQDLEKAFNLYEQASKSRHPAATYRTAVCYEVGGGTKRDPHRAVQFYRKAAALGDTAAMYKLGMIMLKGQLGQHENPREAINWLKRAAAQADEANPHALHQLGLLHAKPENEPPIIPSLIRNEGHAFEEFKRAADLGYAPSCFKLGCCFEYGQLGCPVDPRESIRYYSRAAEKGDASAELALSGWYLTGSETVLKQSDTEAYLWARKAADKGLAKAEYAIGYYTEQGIGVKQNLEEAKRWYMRAAAQGNKRAMQRLTELKHMGSKSHLNRSKHTRAQANKEDCTIC